jgi:MoxR-vWA-beta-propeller ternary system domain bpX2
VAEKEQFVWVRGNATDEKLQPMLRSLPAVDRYELSSGNRLRKHGSRIPAESLPALDWRPLNTWLRVRMPPAEKEGDKPPKELHPVSLRVVRSTEELPPELVMTSVAEWREFAVSAPEFRLRRLRFAADADGNVVIRGKPLPSLPGRQFVLHGNIAVQAGFMWKPAVSAEVLARRLGLSANALALLNEDGTFSKIESEQFVPATRGAVRETAEELRR